MKELVKVNIIKHEKGVVEEDLLELIYDDDSKEYVALGDIGFLDKYKKACANWYELKKWLEWSKRNKFQRHIYWYVLLKMRKLEKSDYND